MNVNKNLIVTKWQDETALERFRMIAPLQDETLDPAKRVQLRKEIAEKKITFEEYVGNLNAGK